ncbi:MAG: hypothetical protein DME23_17060, partial [Verrucomicrobia bacterium]
PVIDQLLNPGSAARWFVPTNDSLGRSWTLPAFDDISWAPGGASVGFDAAVTSAAPPVARAYSFDGNVADVSGHGYDGQNFGAQYSANVPPAVGAGQSLQFDGVANQVQVTDAVNPSAYTLAVWVSVDVVRPSSLIVRTDANGPNTSWSHQLRINSSGRFEHYVWDGSVRVVAATNTIQTGVWYHVVGAAASGGPMQIYVNGASSGGSVTIGNLWGGGSQWRFGTDSGQTPNFFKGRLDEAGIWHAVLGTNDLARLAAGTPPALLDGYRNLIGTDVQAALYRANTSLLLRLPFEVAPGVSYDRLTLNVRYDDGFVAYLNGAEVARRNAPQWLLWDSAATTNRTQLTVLQPETIDLSAFASGLVPGRNVIAVQALNAAAADPDFLFTAELSAREAPLTAGQANLAFNEVAAADSSSFFLELLNHGTADVTLSGCSIVSSGGGRFTFDGQTLYAGGFLTLSTNDLGFTVRPGDKCFLLGAGLSVLDGVKLENRLKGKLPSAPAGRWLYPASPSPGVTNLFALHNEIVINEIMYHAPPSYATNTTPPAMSKNDEQWIELYNRSASPVDLSGWRLDDAVSFTFPTNTILAPDAYLVIANNAAALRAQYPDITVLGDFGGKLSHRGSHLLLRDAQDNPANEVTYYADFPWPAYADGGSSSLELRDPRADNTVPESWAASNEGLKTTWRRYRYVARALNPGYSPNIYSFHEFRLGLLAEGEALLDNIAVVELSTNAPSRQLLQNTNFTAGDVKWRLLGNHSRSRVELDSDNPANPVLHLIAAGPMNYLENQLETTLKVGGTLVPVVAGRDYEISFDAKWLAGSPQVHTELYYNKVAATTLLDRPEHPGTPGRRNSTYVTNAGPTYTGLQNSPLLPGANATIVVSIHAADPDGLAGLTLHYAVNDGTWKSMPMFEQVPGSGSYTGTIPGQPAGSVIQFYVEGADALGAVSTCPAAGADSRALIKVDSPQRVPAKQTFRIIMTPADANLLHSFVNLMSDDLLGCTIIHNEREVFYNARIRLHGSMFSRPDASMTGFHVKFPADHLFRGSRGSVIVRRSGMVESFMKHILNQAGGIPANYDDIVYLVSHRSDNVGSARVNLANYDDTYVDSQFENANDGTVFKFEGIRVYETTDDGTPEGRKLPQPVDFVWSYDITNLGNDPEQYRWSMMIQNQRARDDYSRIVAMGKTFSLGGTALQQAAPTVIDVDEWARYFALQTLLGVVDIYGVDNPHNVAFYARPDNGQVVVLQNDWGFGFQLPTGTSIYGKNNVFKILKLPVYRRLYQGHLLDLMNSVCNRAYVARWAQHYTSVTGENYGSMPGYADARDASVRNQLAAQIPFEITSNGGSNLTVNTPTVTLNGRGWINVHDIRTAGQTNALPVTWLDDQRWQITLPLEAGANNLRLFAFDYHGAQVGQDSITVTTTVSEFPQRDFLRITELMYHPPAPGAAEIAAGFADSDDFEFIELLNTGPTNLSLLGVKFSVGITFDFTASAVTNLAPAQRVLIVKNKAAFDFRYGTNPLVAGEYSGSLNNGGELIRLVDEFGFVIQEFTYDDGGNWPAAADGAGSSLEVLDINGDYNEAANWQASVLVGGTPARPGLIRPAFDSVTYDGAQVRLRFHAAGEQSYTVYGCDSLTTEQWDALATVPSGGSTRIEEVLDDPPFGAPQRFYRLSTP